MGRPALDRLDPELRAELDRRLDRLESKGPIGVAWEDVLDEMITDETDTRSSTSSSSSE
jgi:hypothetical protein